MVDKLEGEWQRPLSAHRNWITPADPLSKNPASEFPAEANRYHIYAAWNCPWAHRCLLTRKFKRLEETISVSYAAPRRTELGWVFDSSAGYRDDLYNATALAEIYARDNDNYQGRITVPVLWDRKTEQIVNNESADIIIMLNNTFEDVAPRSINLYPENIRADIDDWNEDIYLNLNNGVYRAGFADNQEAYENAVGDVFDCMSRIETHLTSSRFLVGSEITLADLRLFPTLARFDVGYFGAFKCNLKRLIDFQNLWNYARDIYHTPGVAETVKFDIYKPGYFSPSEKRNPFGIVPLGPNIDWLVPHNRS
jgi:glutathionyl-hydroquinone reductase